MKKNAIAGVCFNAYSNYFQCIIGLISSLYHIQNKLFKSRCGANRIDESKKTLINNNVNLMVVKWMEEAQKVQETLTVTWNPSFKKPKSISLMNIRNDPESNKKNSSNISLHSIYSQDNVNQML